MAQVSSWQSPGYSNDNLLKNWYFRQPVNQHGQSEYTGVGYTIDMWAVGFDNNNGNKSINVKNGYIEMVTKTPGTWFNFWEMLENKLIKGTYTLSFLVDDYTKVNQLYVTDGVTGKANFAFNSNLCTFTFTVDDDEIVNQMDIQKKEEVGSLKLYAAKLEVGTVSTLAIDLLQPPNYAAQLRECQRYYQKGRACVTVGNKVNYTNDGVYTSYVKLGDMRNNPTITLSTIWVPGYYDYTLIDQSKFIPQPYITQDSTGFYISVLKQGLDIFDNLLGRCIVVDYEASAEL